MISRYSYLLHICGPSAAWNEVQAQFVQLAVPRVLTKESLRWEVSSSGLRGIIARTRTSIDSRVGSSGVVVGSSNAEWIVKRDLPGCAELSNVLNNAASWNSIFGKKYHLCVDCSSRPRTSPTRSLKINSLTKSSFSSFTVVQSRYASGARVTGAAREVFRHTFTIK